MMRSSARREIDRFASNGGEGEVTNSGQAGGKVAAKNKGYTVDYFAQKHRISLPIARALIEQFGDDREALNEAAKHIRKV